MTKNEMGKRIRERRESLDLTQEQLAEKLGYKDKTAVSKIESGHRDLTQSKIVKFADALKTSPFYLMGWTNDPDPTHRTLQTGQQMDEILLLGFYRSLTKEDQTVVFNLVKSMAEKSRKE